jgi:hypothetical protein
MTAFQQFLIVTLFLSLIVASVHSADTTVDITEVFEYSFEDVDPIKIFAGPVVFTHADHVKKYGLSCIACHHTLEAEDAEVEEHCQDCHAKPGFVRGKEAEVLDEDELIEHYLNALHTQCINCHKEKKIEDRKRKIPIGCTQCHDRTKLPSPK